jgi:hypothetical protein
MAVKESDRDAFVDCDIRFDFVELKAKDRFPISTIEWFRGSGAGW